jgi:hypothetical protein
VILIVGLVILVVAAVVGTAGVLANGGGSHALTSGFSVFGYHVTGSTGALFLHGIVVGAVAVFGLSLLLAAARRSSRRGRAARRALKQSRLETQAVSQDRDDLIGQRDAALADPAGGVGSGATPRDQLSPQHRRRARRHLFGSRSSPEPAAATTSVDR